MTRDLWVAERRGEIASLANLATAEIVPSRRDFLQFVDTRKEAIAIVPRLARINPDTGGAWPEIDLVALARVCDDADTAGLAIRTATLHGGSIGDLAAVAAAVTAPLLRDDLCLAPSQVYQSRLRGADAILLPARDLTPDSLADLAAIARSMHMAAVIEVSDESTLRSALAIPTACIGIACASPDGFVDLDRARDVAQAAGTRPTVLLLSEVRRLDELSALRGHIDAAVVGDALLSADDPAGAIAAFSE